MTSADLYAGFWAAAGSEDTRLSFLRSLELYWG